MDRGAAALDRRPGSIVPGPDTARRRAVARRRAKILKPSQICHPIYAIDGPHTVSLISNARPLPVFCKTMSQWTIDQMLGSIVAVTNAWEEALAMCFVALARTTVTATNAIIAKAIGMRQ